MTIRGSRTDPGRNWEPDAGATFLGAYGLRNPMVLWLLRKHPELPSVGRRAVPRS